MAESFPPANKTKYFNLFFSGKRIYPNQSASVGAGVKYHIAHVSRSDTGKYKCSVNIDGYSQALQSNTVERTLIVYGES